MGSATALATVPGANGAKPMPNTVATATDARAAFFSDGITGGGCSMSGQSQRCDSLRGYAFATPGETHALGRGRFNAHARDIDPKNFADACAHGFAVRRDFGTF